MKKIKDLFNIKTKDNQKNNEGKTCLNHLKSNIVQTQCSQKQSDQNNSQKLENCKGCLQHKVLLKKYSNLIKLLKIKIKKLQTSLKAAQQINSKNDKVADFRQFNMDINTASQVTLKETKTSQNIQTSAKILSKNRQTHLLGIVFDQTVANLNKPENINKTKSVKKFVSQMQMFKDQYESKKQNNPKTQKWKQAQQKHNNNKKSGEIGKSVNFIQLMQKSSVSLKSCTNILKQNSKNSQREEVLSIKLIVNSDKVNMRQFNQQNKIKQRPSSKPINQKTQSILVKRIQLLVQTILDLKSFLLHIRHLIFQFVCLSDTQKLKKKQKDVYYVLGVIMNMFQYSEDEIYEMTCQKRKRNRTSNKSKTFQMLRI